MHSRLHPAPPAVATLIRAIGQRRRRPLLTVPRSYLCNPCAVSWAGDEADCWSCGNPASTEYARPTAAALVLLATTRTA